MAAIWPVPYLSRCLVSICWLNFSCDQHCQKAGLVGLQQIDLRFSCPAFQPLAQCWASPFIINWINQPALWSYSLPWGKGRLYVKCEKTPVLSFALGAFPSYHRLYISVKSMPFLSVRAFNNNKKRKWDGHDARLKHKTMWNCRQKKAIFVSSDKLGRRRWMGQRNLGSRQTAAFEISTAICRVLSSVLWNHMLIAIIQCWI